MQRNVNLNRLCRSYRNGISKMPLLFVETSSKNPSYVYPTPLRVCFFSRIKIFHLSDIFQQLAKKTIANGNYSTDYSTDDSTDVAI